MMKPLRILHCLRSPLGGLFRHVCDLSEAQVAQGHLVGVICDASSGGDTADNKLAEMSSSLPLGVKRVEMSRNIGLSDISAFNLTKKLVSDKQIDILHGHGAKGGAYSRLVANSLKNNAKPPLSFYTPHGGSLHYDRTSLKGHIYLSLEQYMMPMTAGLIFESAYSANEYAKKVGALSTEARVIPNGLHEIEFTPHAPQDAAADVIFVGELRHLKGVDVLLKAIADIAKTRPIRVHFYGDGPDTDEFIQLGRELNLQDSVDFPGRMPARAAFNTGKLLVIPSRAESFPYIVLEAAAAAIPMIVTNVGGIPEIVGNHCEMMIKPDDISALAREIKKHIEAPTPFQDRAASLQTDIQALFTVEKMSTAIIEFYNNQLNA